jgi:hypothetical protein
MPGAKTNETRKPQHAGHHGLKQPNEPNGSPQNGTNENTGSNGDAKEPAVNPSGQGKENGAQSTKGNDGNAERQEGSAAFDGLAFHFGRQCADCAVSSDLETCPKCRSNHFYDTVEMSLGRWTVVLSQGTGRDHAINNGLRKLADSIPRRRTR